MTNTPFWERLPARSRELSHAWITYPESGPAGRHLHDDARGSHTTVSPLRRQLRGEPARGPRSGRRLARRCGLVDRPDGHRKLHTQATPLAGGLAILTAGTLTLVLGFALPGQLAEFLALPRGALLGLLLGTLTIAAVRCRGRSARPARPTQAPRPGGCRPDRHGLRRPHRPCAALRLGRRSGPARRALHAVLAPRGHQCLEPAGRHGRSAGRRRSDHRA